MPNLTYTLGRPAENISPSAQRASMETNNDNNATIWTVDHYGFNDNDGGLHEQVTLPNNNAGATQTGASSVVFSSVGVADPTSSQLDFKNSLGGASAVNYILSSIKAWALCSGPAGGIISSQSFNVTSVTRSSAGIYVVVMPSNVVATADYAVFIGTTNCNSAPVADSCFGTLATDLAAPTTTAFTIRTFRQGLTSADPVKFWFAVVQI